MQTRRPSTALSTREQRVETELRRKKLQLSMLHKRRAWSKSERIEGKWKGEEERREEGGEVHEDQSVSIQHISL